MAANRIELERLLKELLEDERKTRDLEAFLRLQEQERDDRRILYPGVKMPEPYVEHLETRALDCKSASFPGLPVFPGLLRPSRPLKICIMTPDITGPVCNGGIGTAYRYASELLAAAGHKVTILYVLGTHSEQGTIEDWVKFYAEKGVEFIPMSDPEIPLEKGEVSRAVRFSYGGYLWLKDHQDFDLVHVSEWRGTGYYAMLAKKLGLAFADTVFCVKCSSPSMWNRQGGSTHIAVQQELAVSYMERRSVELGDIVVSGSLHLLRWMLEHGYRLDRPRCHVQPNIMIGPDGPPAFAFAPRENEGVEEEGKAETAAERPKLPVAPGGREKTADVEAARIEIDEIVFFGRLEPRKGIYIFCDAIERLAASDVHPKKVVFLGKISKVFPAAEFIKNRSADWPFDVEIVSHLSQLEVAEFLSHNNRLAVIPSLLENSSFAIYECLMHGIPFICSTTGGSPELIHPDVRGEILFKPHPGNLFQSVDKILRDGLLPPRASFDNDWNTLTWLNWHASLTGEGQIQSMSAAFPGVVPEEDEDGKVIPLTWPKVSVCLNHFNRPVLVQQALDSIKQQNYPNLEVILVDDGSTHGKVPALLKDLEAEFLPFGWQIIQQDNRYVGAARNRAAAEADGEFLLFMDDDAYAEPKAISTFVDVARRSGADVLTSFAYGFDGQEKPNLSCPPESAIPCLGPAAGYGFFMNGYGGSFCLVRRSIFEQLGGFSEAYKVGYQSEEFYARATLEGYRVEVVPLPLYWSRSSEGRANALEYNSTATTICSLQPYIDAAPFAYRNILLYASSLQQQVTQKKNQGKNPASQKPRPGSNSSTASKKRRPANGPLTALVRGIKRRLG